MIMIINRIIRLSFLLFFLFAISKSQCTDSCICENYLHNEDLNIEGVSQCSNQNHCLCNNTRMCNAQGWCDECGLYDPCPPIICPLGKYKSGSICLSCGDQCIRCNSGPNLCLECNLGYYLFSGYCTICPNGCANCTSIYYCSECQPNYFMLYDKVN